MVWKALLEAADQHRHNYLLTRDKTHNIFKGSSKNLTIETKNL